MAVENGHSIKSKPTTHLTLPTDLLSLPTHYLNTYKTFVRQNTSRISQIESTLRSLTYLLPTGTASHSPLPSETLHTLLALLTAYHTSLLPSPHPPSPRARYQDWCARQSKVYERCRAMLRTLQYTQLLVEMVAKRAGESVRWRVVVLLEVVKAVLRVAMGRGSGGRMVVETGVGDERGEKRGVGDGEGDATAAAGEAEEGVGWDGMGDAPGGDSEGAGWKMPRTGMRLPVLPVLSNGESVTEFLGKRVIGADEVKSARRLVRRIETVQGQVAELMWILRPVAYALALQRYQGNRRDWRPWALGLAMEVAARQLLKRDVNENVVGGLRGLSGVERDEMKSRGWDVAWWGMRGSFYENVTRTWIQGFAGRLKGKPLLDMVGVVIEDYDYLWGEYYFPTATL